MSWSEKYAKRNSEIKSSYVGKMEEIEKSLEVLKSKLLERKLVENIDSWDLDELTQVSEYLAEAISVL